MFSQRQTEFEADLRKLPLFLEGICAGFPSPADDHIDKHISIDDLVVRNPPATFFMTVNGHSMKDAGIYDGDLLVIDCSLAPRHGDVVVAIVHGERSIKRFLNKGGQPRLSFENREFPPYPMPGEGEFEVWGVVVCNIHWLRGRR